MTDLRKAAEQALEALERLVRGAEDDCGEPRCDECEVWRPSRAAMTALRAALGAQEPKQEPVASESQTLLRRWAHATDEVPETESQRGYDAARAWVREVGLPALDAQEDEALKLYQQLLMAVGQKHPGETRHETALRYITQAESQSVGPDQAKEAQR